MHTMMTFLTRRTPVLLASFFAAAVLRSWAGDGHDHGEAASPLSGSARPRFAATSENFELVGVLDGTHITLYLDRTDDNSPVKDAQLELELGGNKLMVEPHGEGEYEATLAAPVPPGTFAVSAAVVAGQEADLLAGELDLHGDAPPADRIQGTPWARYGGWSMAVMAALSVLIMVLRRWGTARHNGVGGAA
jgi:hypothetical protein